MAGLADDWVGMVGSQAGMVGNPNASMGDTLGGSMVDTQDAMMGSLDASMVNIRVGKVSNPVGMVGSLVVSKVDSQFDEHAAAAYYGAFHSYSASYRFAFDSCPQILEKIKIWCDYSP